MEKSRKRLLVGTAWALAFSGLVLLSGCAGEKKPVSSLSQADFAIQRARDAHATELSSPELKMAEDKLAEAKSAADRGDNKEARQLADEAKAAAQTAEAKARSQAARKQAQEMQQSVATLRQNITPPPPPAAPPAE